MAYGGLQSDYWAQSAELHRESLRHMDDYLRICGVYHADVVNAWIGHHGIYKTAGVGILITVERMCNGNVMSVQNIEYLHYIYILELWI